MIVLLSLHCLLINPLLNSVCSAEEQKLNKGVSFDMEIPLFYSIGKFCCFKEAVSVVEIL